MTFRKNETRVGAFQLVAIAIGIHGLLYAFFGYILSYTNNVPDMIDGVYNAAFILPAHYMVFPLEDMLWKLGLMQINPFAWPDVWGMLLVYTIWVVSLLVVHRIFGLITSMWHR